MTEARIGRVHRAKNFVQGVKKGAFDHSAPPRISLHKTQKIVDVDVPMVERTLQKIPMETARGGDRRDRRNGVSIITRRDGCLSKHVETVTGTFQAAPLVRGGQRGVGQIGRRFSARAERGDRVLPTHRKAKRKSNQWRLARTRREN